MIQCKVFLDQENMIGMLTGQQFYGEEDAYLRALLQNAMDACSTRAALEWSWGTEFLEMEEAQALNSMRDAFQPQISVSYSSLTQRLIVEDNGIGINAKDLEQYVSKLGCSYYKSEEFERQQLDYEPISEFGVGLLSSFVVARALLIESRKDKCVNTAWNVTDRESLEPVTAKWLEGAESIEYIVSQKEESGSKITLVLKPKYAMKVTLQRMANAIRHYMLYQPFPIEVSYDSRKLVLHERNQILENPYADVIGIIAIRIEDDLLEGYIWIYNSKHQDMVEGSRLYQQGFLVADESQDIGIKPEWLRHMSYRLHLKKRYLNLRTSRDGVAMDEQLKQLREKIGQCIVRHFAGNPLGLNQYLSDGRESVLTEYEDEMQLLAKAVTVEVYLKGREIELPIETIIHGFEGKVIRIALISKGLFQYYRLNYFIDFKRFQRENKLIVFEKNRDIFCQMIAPYMKSQRYVISEYPGIIYDDMVADFHMLRSVVPYRNVYSLRPPRIGYDDIFCLVTNNHMGTLDIIVNEDHRLAKMLQPVWYHPKVHRMIAVILENIKQRIINSQHRWNRIIDFGGFFIDDWNPKNVATVQSIWCLESDFAVYVNEYIATILNEREKVDLGLVGLTFRREDFINWWFTPRE